MFRASLTFPGLAFVLLFSFKARQIVSAEACPRAPGGLFWRTTFSILLLSTTVSIQAQELPDDPVKAARVHLGPLGLNPKVAIVNVGIDNNVFNETVNPKRD